MQYSYEKLSANSFVNEAFSYEYYMVIRHKSQTIAASAANDSSLACLGPAWLKHHHKRKSIAPAVRDFHSKYKGEVL